MEAVISRYIALRECPSCQRKVEECPSLKNCLLKAAQDRFQKSLPSWCPLCEHPEPADSQLSCYEIFEAKLRAYENVPLGVSQHLGMSERIGGFKWYSSKSGIVLLKTGNNVTESKLPASNTSSESEPASSTWVADRRIGRAPTEEREPELRSTISVSGSDSRKFGLRDSPSTTPSSSGVVEEELASSSSSIPMADVVDRKLCLRLRLGEENPENYFPRQENSAPATGPSRQERRWRRKRFKITLPKTLTVQSRVVDAEVLEPPHPSDATRDEEHDRGTNSSFSAGHQQRCAEFAKIVAALVKVFGDCDPAKLGEVVTVLANMMME